MGSQDLSASDFMTRTSELLNRKSAEPVVLPAAPTGGSLAARTDDLLARTAALLGKPIPATPAPAIPAMPAMPTSVPVAESSVFAPETPSPAPAGSFAQRSSDLLARTAQLLGKPIAADSPGAAAPPAYSVASPPPAPMFSPTPAFSPPPVAAAPAAEGSFAQRSADLLARTAQLLGKAPVADGSPAPPQPMMASPPPMMVASPPPMPMAAPPAGAAPQGGSFNQRADDLLARTAALLGGAPQAPPAAAAPSPLPVALPPSVEHAMQTAAPGSGSFAQRSDDLLARTAALLGKNPSASYDASAIAAPGPAPVPVALPPSVEHSMQAAGPGSGSFAQRSDDLLARTAALLGKNPSASFDVTASAAPQIPPPTAYEQPHSIAAPFVVPDSPAPMPPPPAAAAAAGGGGGNFAQRSADVLARTAQLLNKSQDPAPELELLKMLRQAQPVGGSSS